MPSCLSYTDSKLLANSIFKKEEKGTYEYILLLPSDWWASTEMLAYFGEAARPTKSCIDPFQSLLSQNTDL